MSIIKLFLFSDTWKWLANHSGYHRLYDYVSVLYPNTQLFATKYSLLRRVLGKLYSLSNRWPARNQNESFAELYFSSLGHPKQDGFLYHILYMESHHLFFEKWDKVPNTIIATIHHPWPRLVPKRLASNIQRLSHAIILSKDNISWYENYVPNVWYIRHGVDTVFFFPADTVVSTTPRWIFVGHNGRDTEMLAETVQLLANTYPEWRLDCFVPENYRYFRGLQKISAYSQVHWHDSASDLELREMYQKSHCLIMPMQECSANNAILEALACGCPIATTNVAALHDYGAHTIFPVVTCKDAVSLASLVQQYTDDIAYRQKIAVSQRQFAEANLAWPIIAKKHLEIYKHCFDSMS